MNIGKNAWLRPNGWYIVVSTVRFYVCDYGNHTGFIFLTIYYGQVVELVDTAIWKVAANSLAWGFESPLKNIARNEF